MEFHKFHSIENSYREKFLDNIKMSPCAKEEWCVMEKIHGANFSFTSDGKDVIPGKRTCFLLTEEEMELFYDCVDLVERIRDKVLKFYNYLQEITPDKIGYFTIFGELFGGYYPGLHSEDMRIQKDIFYHSRQLFYAFGVRVMIDKTKTYYINYDQAISLFRKAGIFYAEILFRGTLADCLSWSDEHLEENTTIPNHFGLTEIKDNIREGHVIKPIVPAYTSRREAIILKHKNSKFSEISGKKPRKTHVLEGDVEKTVGLAVQYVNKQRYDSVVSKYGPEIKKNIGKLIGLFTQDALQDFRKDHGNIKKNKQINKQITEAVKKLVTELN